MKRLDHLNILKIFEYFNDNKFIYIVSELCTGGELHREIVKNGFLPEKTVCIYMQQLLSAI